MNLKFRLISFSKKVAFLHQHQKNLYMFLGKHIQIMQISITGTNTFVPLSK